MDEQGHGDCIMLAGMVFYAYHGALPEERTLGQRFIVDLHMGVDLLLAGQTDDLTQTVHYGHVYAAARHALEGPPLNLLEAVAQRVASAVLAGFPTVTWVSVTVKKPGVAIAGSILDHAAVRITRARAT